MSHVGDRNPRSSLAGVAGMSTRNFARHFVQATRITPHDFVDRARIDAARRLLEAGDQPFKAVAYACGFGTAARSEEHTSELQSLMRISYAVFCLNKTKTQLTTQRTDDNILQ